MRWNPKSLTVLALLAAASLSWAATTADMDAQMKKMSEMHQKMMNAKTAEERQALMDDHMKAMRGGMDMMKGKGSMEHKQGMGGMKGKSEDHTSHHRMMEKRMEMMDSMIEMMMDRLPQAPSK